MPTKTVTGADWRAGDIFIRPIEPSDWEALATDEFDPETQRAGSGYLPTPWSAERLRAWCSELERSSSKDEAFVWLIVRVADNVPVGTINTHHCRPRTGVFSYGISILTDQRRRGYARSAIQLVLAYYFGELRYQKAAVCVYGFNDGSLDLHRRLGFRVEGRARRAVYTAGAFHDQVWLGLTAEEFAATRAEPVPSAVPDTVEYRLRPRLDLNELSDLRRVAWDPPGFGGPALSGDFASVLERSFTWVGAFDGDAVVGFVNVAWDGGVHFFLLDTTVHPDWQHRGVGTGLVQRAIEACRGHGDWIHVDAGTELAPFYRQAGFTDTEWAGLAPLRRS